MAARWLSILVVTAGCVGDTAPDETGALGSPDTGARPLVIASYGDSTMFGSTLVAAPDTYAQAAITPPGQLGAMLAQTYGSAVTVTNNAIPGSTCYENFYGGTFGALVIPRSWADEMAASPARVVIMNVGINDAYLPTSGTGREGFAWESEPDFQGCLIALAETAIAAGKVFVFETPNAITTDHAPQLADRYADYYVAARQIEASHPDTTLFVDMYAFTSSHLDIAIPGTTSWRERLSDQIHPDATGYMVKAIYEADTISPWVGASLERGY